MSSDIVVRRSRASDAAAIHRLRADPAVRRFQPLEQRSREEIEQALLERGTVPLTARTSGKLEWIIEADGVVAGWVTVTVTSRGHHTGSIGYSLDPRFHRRGIGSHAVGEVTTIALDSNQLALQRLEAVAAVDNIASRRVLERCGYAFEGIARGLLIIDGRRVDHARYARLQEE